MKVVRGKGSEKEGLRFHHALSKTAESGCLQLDQSCKLQLQMPKGAQRQKDLQHLQWTLCCTPSVKVKAVAILAHKEKELKAKLEWRATCCIECLMKVVRGKGSEKNSRPNWNGVQLAALSVS